MIVICSIYGMQQLQRLLLHKCGARRVKTPGALSQFAFHPSALSLPSARDWRGSVVFKEGIDGIELTAWGTTGKYQVVFNGTDNNPFESESLGGEIGVS
jgi:hypothetical protein